MEDKKVLNTAIKIIEYLKEKHNFTISIPRLSKLVKEYGFPITKIGSRNILSRSDLIDQWMEDLFNKRIIGEMWSKFDINSNPVRKKRKARKKTYRPIMKRGRKPLWKKGVKEKDSEKFINEIEGFTKWKTNKTKRSFISAGKKMLQHKISPLMAARLIEQVAWAMYSECLRAYEIDGVPYLDLRKQKAWGTWWAYALRKEE